MPNHVQNELIIRANSYVEILAIWNAIKNADGNGIDFDRIIPYPQEYKDLDAAAEAFDQKHGMRVAGRPKDGFNSGGYDWCVENWGTKWGTYQCVAIRLPELYDEEVPDEGTCQIVLEFQTAWSPPIPVIDAIAKRWPRVHVSLQYWERGMQFQGMYMLERGEVLHHIRMPYYGHRGG